MKDKSNRSNSRLQELATQAKAVERAIQESVREALLAHKRAGQAVAGWRDGRVVWVPPEEIPIDDELTPADGSR
jgi:hypothetical protein